MMLGHPIVAEIRRLYFAEQWEIEMISAELDVHCETVTRVLDRFRAPDLLAQRSMLKLGGVR
jgi:hypothetical protein